MASSSIPNYSILFLIIMKDKGPKVFKLVKLVPRRLLFLIKSKASCFFVFLKYFWMTQVLFVVPLIPLFWTSGDISPGFQSQSGQSHSHLVEVHMSHVPVDSPLVWFQPTSQWPVWQPSCSLPHTCEQVFGGLETRIYCAVADSQFETRQTLYQLSYVGSAKASCFSYYWK